MYNYSINDIYLGVNRNFSEISLTVRFYLEIEKVWHMDCLDSKQSRGITSL